MTTLIIVEGAVVPCIIRDELICHKAMDQEQVTHEWNALATDWDDLAKYYALSFYKTLESKHLLSFHEDSQSVVLDFGCGTGLLADHLRNKCGLVVAVDASPNMVAELREKVLSREWTNVVALNQVLARSSPTLDALLDKYRGKVDLIVASSVLNFIPELDLPNTLAILASLLKPTTGRLCHSDWPQDDTEHPNGMTVEKATHLYQSGGMVMIESDIIAFTTDPAETKAVYFGIAKLADTEAPS